MLVLTVLALTTAAESSAATLTVCSSGCQYTTIGGALSAANDGDEIVIGPGAYNGGFTIDRSVSLVGADASTTTISGGGPVLTIGEPFGATEPRVSISGVTISGGSYFFGGGIWNNGTLSLASSVITANTGIDGGGIFNFGGALSVTASSVTGNTADEFGGGIWNSGSLSLDDSNVSGNTATEFDGGGIFTGGAGTLSLDASIVRGNTAGGTGGGIANEAGGPVSLDDSMVRNNTAGGNGGGIWNNGTVSLDNSMIRNNIAGGDGGGIWNDWTFDPITGLLIIGTVTVTDSAIRDNQPDDLVNAPPPPPPPPPPPLP